jgi:hypothetical protein
MVFAILAAFGWAPAAEAAPASLRVESGRFVLTLEDGRTLGSAYLVGAELKTEDGRDIRIDAVAPAAERPSILLHSFSLRGPTGAWAPLCDPDATGRRSGLPIAGSWSRDGRKFEKDAARWFLTCSSGAQGKCVLWGYEPWGRGPQGEDLAPFYQACQFTVRANYDGRGEAHTRNGTPVDFADAIGIASFDTATDPTFGFEAGWGPNGAVCVARTRWPDLLDRATLIESAPALAGPCDEQEARRRGALIVTRVKLRPALGGVW